MNRRLRILAVEDDLPQAELLRVFLRDHDVQTVDTAAGALEAVSVRRFDLVLSDIHLPGMDGLELLSELKQRAPNTPVVMVSAHQRVDLLMRALNHRAEGYLVKPLSRAVLRAKVEEVTAAAKGLRVLAIGAHPDDVEIGCGGTLARHVASGDRVTVLTLSSGASGGDPASRQRESRRAADRLGADLILADLPDTRFTEGPETIDPISRAVREVRPDVVYVHGEQDTHQDHRAVHRATRVAARNVSTVLMYQSPSTTIDFSPTRFVDVTDHMSDKLELLRAFAGQAERAYLADDLIESTARYWGRFAGYGLVEPFEVMRDAAAA